MKYIQSHDLGLSLDLRVFQLIWLHLGPAFIVVLFNGGLLPHPSIDWRSFGEWIFSSVYLYDGTKNSNQCKYLSSYQPMDNSSS